MGVPWLVTHKTDSTVGIDAVLRLMPFIEREHKDRLFPAILFNLQDYIELVDFTGRAVRHDKRGSIASTSPKALARLGISDEQWLVLALDIQRCSVTMLAGLEQLEQLERLERLERRSIRNAA